MKSSFEVVMFWLSDTHSRSPSLHFVPSLTCCVLVGPWFYTEYAELMASEDSSSYTLTLAVAISLGKNVEDVYGCDELKFLRWGNYPDLSD